MEKFLKSQNGQYIIGGIVVLALLYFFVFKDKVDSAAITLSGYDFDTDPEKLDQDLVMKKGSRGANVAALQTKMLADGADLGKSGSGRDGVDGVFGSITERELQRIKGVPTASLKSYDATASIQPTAMTDNGAHVGNLQDAAADIVG